MRVIGEFIPPMEDGVLSNPVGELTAGAGLGAFIGNAGGTIGVCWATAGGTIGVCWDAIGITLGSYFGLILGSDIY